MFIYKKLAKITVSILFVIIIIFFSTLNAKNIDKYNKSDKISDYFSGVVLLDQNKYKDSYKHLRKLEGLEKSHPAFSKKYLFTLVNSENFTQAFNFSKKLEKEKNDRFESNLVVGIYYLKNSNFELSKKYFLKAKQMKSKSLLDSFLIESLYNWSNLKNIELEKAEFNLSKLDNRFENLKKIQNTFLNCYYGSDQTENIFYNLISNKKTDFTRYNYFYANYLDTVGESSKAKKIIEISLKKSPRNLLLNQYKIDLQTSEKNFDFDCKKEKHVIAELLYISANALASQSIFSLSNFYLNLAKFLNKDFKSFDTLLAENFYKIEDFAKAKKIYESLNAYGDAFKWYSDKQISRILIQEKEKDQSLSLLKKSYQELKVKGIYETFDYAEFLKNNEQFKNAIKYYSKILNKIDNKHPLYPEVMDGRGVAYERIGVWNKAETDLLNSLDADPDQAYVINYLAYSWIEKGIKINKSLGMLEKANKLKSNDPFIIDSLGWALFKLERYEESKKYLQLAVKLMPADPVVNDHYGDVLWKNGKKIQARYYWNYVLNLEKAEQDLKEKIQKKLVKGL